MAPVATRAIRGASPRQAKPDAEPFNSSSTTRDNRAITKRKQHHGLSEYGSLDYVAGLPKYRLISRPPNQVE
jgi:hypothetical protein